MGRKLVGLTSFLFSKSSSSCTTSSAWVWPSCNHPRTQSFRDINNNKNSTTDPLQMFKTTNSVYYIDTSSAENSFNFTNTTSIDQDQERSESFSSVSSSAECVETVIKGLRSDRLFFETGESSSILEEAKKPFKESVVLAVESEDPYKDFRVSMEEMVVSEGIKDWDSLEELLVWYLRVNEKKTHGYILGAFVDFILGLVSSSSSSSSPSTISNSYNNNHCSSSFSYSASSSSPSSPVEDEIIEGAEEGSCRSS